MYWSGFKPGFLHTKDHASNNGRRLQLDKLCQWGEHMDGVRQGANIQIARFKDASGENNFEFASSQYQAA